MTDPTTSNPSRVGDIATGGAIVIDVPLLTNHRKRMAGGVSSAALSLDDIRPGDVLSYERDAAPPVIVLRIERRVHGRPPLLVLDWPGVATDGRIVGYGKPWWSSEIGKSLLLRRPDLLPTIYGELSARIPHPGDVVTYYDEEADIERTARVIGLLPEMVNGQACPIDGIHPPTIVVEGRHSPLLNIAVTMDQIAAREAEETNHD